MNNQPVNKIKIGCIEAAIWANQSENGPYHTVTISRSYKDGETWKSTESLRRDDTLVAAKALDLAHTWITSQA